VGTPSTACHEGWSLPLNRFAGFAGEGLQAKGGAKGGTDWEWALGAASALITSDLTWQAGKSYSWQLGITSAGQGSFSVLDGTSVIAQGSYTNATNKLHLGRAIKLGVTAASDVGSAKIAATLTSVNGQATSMSAATDAPSQNKEAALYLSSIASGITAQGTLRLDYSTSAPPQGTRLLMNVQAGNASCQ
jgi:hypothetical protein